MKKNRIPSEADHRTVQARRRYGALVLIVLACAAMTCPALAADDPLTIVGNLSDFVFSIIKALGVIILGWGIVQRYVHPVPRCQPANAGLSVPVRRPDDRLCQRDSYRHWRGLTERGRLWSLPLLLLWRNGVKSFE